MPDRLKFHTVFIKLASDSLNSFNFLLLHNLHRKVGIVDVLSMLYTSCVTVTCVTVIMCHRVSVFITCVTLSCTSMSLCYVSLCYRVHVTNHCFMYHYVTVSLHPCHNSLFQSYPYSCHKSLWYMSLYHYVIVFMSYFTISCVTVFMSYIIVFVTCVTVSRVTMFVSYFHYDMSHCAHVICYGVIVMSNFVMS